MPYTPTGGIFYWAGFIANGVNAGFDVNHSGYGETVEINQTVRPVPWANPGQYVIVTQQAGYQPITRQYQVTVYQENDYRTLRSLVGRTGVIVTPREGGSPGTPEPATLVSVKRGSYQYPAWPNTAAGNYAGTPGTPQGHQLSAANDIQTLILDFLMLAN